MKRLYPLRFDVFCIVTKKQNNFLCYKAQNLDVLYHDFNKKQTTPPTQIQSISVVANHPNVYVYKQIYQHVSECDKVL